MDQFSTLVGELKKLEYQEGERKRVSTKDKYADLGDAIYSWYEEGDFMVPVVWGGGFPAKHQNYVYVESGNIKNNKYFRNFKSGRRMNENWFRTSD